MMSALFFRSLCLMSAPAARRRLQTAIVSCARAVVHEYKCIFHARSKRAMSHARPECTAQSSPRCSESNDGHGSSVDI